MYLIVNDLKGAWAIHDSVLFQRRWNISIMPRLGFYEQPAYTTAEIAEFSHALLAEGWRAPVAWYYDRGTPGDVPVVRQAAELCLKIVADVEGEWDRPDPEVLAQRHQLPVAGQFTWAQPSFHGDYPVFARARLLFPMVYHALMEVTPAQSIALLLEEYARWPATPDRMVIPVGQAYPPVDPDQLIDWVTVARAAARFRDCGLYLGDAVHDVLADKQLLGALLAVTR